MYNKSEIFKMAWAIKKSNNYTTFSSALFSAWVWAKDKAVAEKDTIAASEVNVNDIIEIEHADFGNVVSVTVTGIRVENFGRNDMVAVNAVRANGTKAEFCLALDKRVRKTGEAAVEMRFVA